MKKLNIFLLVFLFPLGLSAQNWEPLAANQGDFFNKTHWYDGIGGFQIFQGELWIFPSTIDEIVKYDGKNLTKVQGHQQLGYSAGGGGIVVNNEMYLYVGNNTHTHANALIQYNGKTWTKLAEAFGFGNFANFNNTLLYDEIYETNSNNKTFLQYDPLTSHIDTILNDSTHNIGYFSKEINNKFYTKGQLYYKGNKLYGILEWDGTDWYQMSIGTTVIERDIISYNNQLFIGGDDSFGGSTDNSPMRKVQAWNGTTWTRFGEGAMGGIYNLLVHKGILYAFGTDTTGGGYSIAYAKKYNNLTWQNLSSQKLYTTFEGITSSIVYKDELYVGGFLDSIDQQHVSLVYKMKLLNDLNFSPSAAADRDTLNEDTETSIAVTKNDSDRNGDYLLTGIIKAPKHGTATVTPSDAILYQPNNNYVGRDTIFYRVCDQGGLCDSNFVYLLIRPVNDLPVAKNDSAKTQENESVVIRVQENDSDVDDIILTTNIISNPTKGTATLLNSDSIRYTPNKDFYGNDQMMYSVCDASNACDTATVFITVKQTIGLEERNTENRSFYLYPNPASDKLYIAYKQIGKSPIQMMINNVLGQTLGRYTLEVHTKGSLEIDLTNYPEGIYFCRFYTETSKEEPKRLVIVK